MELARHIVWSLHVGNKITGPVYSISAQTWKLWLVPYSSPVSLGYTSALRVQEITSSLGFQQPQHTKQEECWQSYCEFFHLHLWFAIPVYSKALSYQVKLIWDPLSGEKLYLPRPLEFGVSKSSHLSEQWHCQMVGLCHWGGFRWEGSILVRPASGLGKPRGMRSMSHLLLHRQGDFSSHCKLYHSPPMPESHALPWILESQAGQNLNLVLWCLEGWRSDFHPAWLCPTWQVMPRLTFLCSQGQCSMSCPVLSTLLELGTGFQRAPTYKRASIRVQ